MSVLIKGMEMPHNCLYCKLSYLKGVRLFCFVNGNEVIRSEISPKCPMVEVPPHGRLIDADALDSELLSVGVNSSIINRYPKYKIGEVRAIIKNAPTIIPSDKDGE